MAAKAGPHIKANAPSPNSLAFSNTPKGRRIKNKPQEMVKLNIQNVSTGLVSIIISFNYERLLGSDFQTTNEYTNANSVVAKLSPTTVIRAV